MTIYGKTDYFLIGSNTAHITIKTQQNFTGYWIGILLFIPAYRIEGFK